MLQLPHLIEGTALLRPTPFKKIKKDPTVHKQCPIYFSFTIYIQSSHYEKHLRYFENIFAILADKVNLLTVQIM